MQVLDASFDFVVGATEFCGGTYVYGGGMSKAKRERHAKILAELAGSPSLRIADLARLHEVSAETIRRDLDELTRNGHLSRTYGGAVKAAPSEPVVSERHLLFVREREQIAQLAVAELQGAKTILIGSGSTTVHVARRMAAELKDITVLTHSFGVATVLSMNPTIKVVVLPGDYHATEGAMVGGQCVDFIRKFNVDWAVLGASGLGVEGPSEALLDCSVIYSVMANRARRVMVVADHSKFGLVYPGQYCTWERVDCLVTDRAPPLELMARIDADNLRY